MDMQTFMCKRGETTPSWRIQVHAYEFLAHEGCFRLRKIGMMFVVQGSKMQVAKDARCHSQGNGALDTQEARNGITFGQQNLAIGCTSPIE